MNRNAWLAAAMAVIVLGALAGLVAISEQYPFYFIWDMDQTTALDVALINAGKHPDHLNHTAIGMYAVMRVTSLIATHHHLITTASYNLLQSALNPLVPVAEITTFLRLHTPFVIVATAVAGFAGVAVTARMRAVSIAGLALLALLLSQTWTIYHAAYIRSETYALLFWQLGLLSFGLATLGRSHVRALALAILSGAFVGVALMTKLQMLPHLCAYYLLAKMMLDFRREPNANASADRPPFPVLSIALNAAGVLVFAFLWSASGDYDLSSGYFVMSNISEKPTYGIGPAGMLFLAIAAALLVVQLLFRWVRLLQWLFERRDLAMFSAIQVGFALSAFLPLAMYSDVDTGWGLTLANFKVAFLRELETAGTVATLSMISENVLGWISHYPWLAAAVLLAYGLFAVLAWIAPLSRERWLCFRVWLWSSVVIAAFLIGSVFFRFYLRDMIWHEALMTLLVGLLLCVAAGVVERCWPQVKHFSSAIVVLPALVLITVNVAAYATVRQKTELNYNIYGWSASHAFLHVYTGNQFKYRDLMRERFSDQRIAPDTTAGMALRQAVEWREVLRAAAFVLPYQRVPTTSVGVFAPGAVIAAADVAGGPKLLEVPKALAGAVLIDLGDLPRRRSRRVLDGNLVSVETEDFDKITVLPASGRMAAVPRNDLEVFHFKPSGVDVSCDLRATAARAGEPPGVFCGVPVKRYIEIDRAAGPPGFLVIQRVFGW